MIWTTAMYIYFFHFEVRVASGDCRLNYQHERAAEIELTEIAAL